MENINQFVKNNNIGETLYYPGAFSDWGPLRYFLLNSSITKVIYADYATEEMSFRFFLEKMRSDGWEIVDIKPLSPADFKKESWAEFWPENPDSYKFGNPSDAYGHLFHFRSPNGKDAFLYYIGTEAIQTYSVLCENNLKPDVIVLQDHGTGGNWSFFGGELKDNQHSPLYEASLSLNSLPGYLFVCPNENTSPWPNYEQITETISLEDSLHQSQGIKALYRRK